MPLPSLQSYVKVAWIQMLHGVECVSTMNMYFPQAGDEVAMEGLAAICIGAWADNMLDVQSFQHRFTSVQLRQLIPGAGVAIDGQAGPSDYGAITVDADNTVLATVASLRTIRAGRSYRGRMFVAGMPNNVVQDGLIDSGYRDLVATKVQDVITSIRNASTANPVILSYFSNKAQRATPVATSINTVISSTAYPAVLRSRQRRA